MVKIFAVCMLLLSTLWAQQTVRSVDYARTLWKVADGLPEETIQALVEGSDGSLWIGTTGGLAKTGGGRIRTPIPTPSVTCIANVSDNTFWVGTEGEGLLHLVGRGAQIYAEAKGLTNGFVRAVLQDSRGQIWVGTDRGLFQLSGERLVRFNLGVESSDLAVRSLIEDTDGNIWAGGSQLLTIDRAGHSSGNLPAFAAGSDVIFTMLQTRKSGFLVGTSSGLKRLQDGALVSIPEIHFPVRALLQASDNTLLIGTSGGGLWNYRNGRFQRIDSAGMLPSETILSLLQDQFNQVWVGTRAGLVRLEQSAMALVPIPNLSDGGAETVSSNGKTIWVAAGRVYAIQGASVHRADFGMPEEDIRLVHHSADGSVWLGTGSDGVYRIQHGRREHLTAPLQLTNNVVRGFLNTDDGSTWIATENGITIAGRTRIVKLQEQQGLAYASTRTLFQDRDGTVWIGTDRGLSAWQAGRFRHNEATDALAQEKVWSVLQDRLGNLWFGTREHGLYRYREHRLDRFTTGRGLPTNSIYKILQDRNGTFWFSGPNIIFSLQEGELEADTPAASPLNPVLYTIPSDGVQMYGGQESSGVLADDGGLWFPSNRGVAHIAVTQASSSASAPQIWTMTDAGFQEPLHSPPENQLAAGRISYRLVAVYLRPQEALRFRYRLDGLDTSWTQIRPDELVTYTNLRPGRYRLHVQAIDFATTGAVSERIVEIYKAPYLYQTWWFYLLCATCLTLLSWLLYRLRIRQVRTRFAAVLSERARIAREMHDTVIQGCTGISVLIEAIQTAEGDEHERSVLLGYAKELTSSTVNQARQAVWAVRHEPEASVNLTEELCTIAEQTQREYRDIAIHVEHEKDAIYLPNSVAHEMIMTAREAVYNAVQHSGTNRITLEMWMQSDKLHVCVTDFGRGIYNPDEARDGHYGVRGMRERMKRIGGELHITSTPGSGTRVSADVPRVSALRPIATGMALGL